MKSSTQMTANWCKHALRLSNTKRCNTEPTMRFVHIEAPTSSSPQNPSLHTSPNLRDLLPEIKKDTLKAETSEGFLFQ
jgi:hypothetical protein